MEGYSYDRYSFDGSGKTSWVTNTTAGGELNAALDPLGGLRMLMGIEYKNYSWQSTSIGLDAAGAQLPATQTAVDEKLDTTGSFFEMQYRPFQWVKASAGIRHERHSEFGSEELMRFGLILNPIQYTVLKLSHGEHFLAPTPNDLFWPVEDWGWGMGASGNPDLKPEMGVHKDLTFEQSLADNQIFWSFSYFQWDMDSRILWASDAAGFWQPRNLNSYQADGFEIGARLRPMPQLSLSLDYTYLHAEEEAEEYDRVVPSPTKSWQTRRATYSPEKQFKATLAWGFPAAGLSAATTVRYVSRRPWYRDETLDYFNYKTVEYRLDAYWTVDVKLEQRLFDRWVISLSGTNLLNEAYETYLATFFDNTTLHTAVATYPGQERSFYLKLSYEH
jgi:iron complex outermembrane receptor protein